MVCSVRRFGAAALFSLALLALLGPRAQAQYPSPFSTNPGLLANPFGPVNNFGYNRAILGNQIANLAPAILAQSLEARALNYGLGARAAALSTVPGGYAGIGTTPWGYGGLGGYGGYGYGGYGFAGYATGYLMAANPYSGYLSGAASVTRANADWLVKVQDARLKREKARQASVDTRRKIFEELMWEQKMKPTWNDIREKEQAARLRHFRNTASPTDVWSATALNGILENVAREQARGSKGPTVPLGDLDLKKINLTNGANRGNIGLLKDDGKLSWPTQLEAAPFTKAREGLSREIKDAVQQAKFGNRVEAGRISAMFESLKELNATLHDQVNSMSPSRYIAAQRYLNQVRDAIRALESPDVVKYFNHDWEAKGTTVAELVKHMADKGLRFAPATAGDYDAYTALFNKLRAYDDGVTPTKPKYYTPPSPEGVSSPSEK